MISPHECVGRLQDHARAVRGGIDPECVHQLRVTAGRLSVWLELGERRMLRDDLSWLRRSASPTRDLDVVLEWLASPPSSAMNGSKARASACISGFELSARDPEPNPKGTVHLFRTATEWSAHLREQRESTRLALVHALASPRFVALLAALAWMPTLDRKRARSALPLIRRRVERAGARLERRPEDLNALHRLRRAVRRLRYALEWIGDDVRAVKTLQDDLGELNNLAMFLQHLDLVSPHVAAENRNGSANAAREGEANEPRFDRAAGSANERPGSANSAVNGSAVEASPGPGQPRDDIRREIVERRARFLHDWSRTRTAIERG